MHANTHQQELLQCGKNGPWTIIRMRALIFHCLSFSLCRAWRRFPVVVMNQLAVVQQNPAKDTSQMKFSPSQETLSPFVFIILTSRFKELSSPTSPVRLLCLSHPSHYHHLFGAHPGWGAAMCFSHSSLPQKMCRREGGDEERHLLTKINRHLLSLLYICGESGEVLTQSGSALGPFHTWLQPQDLLEAENMYIWGKILFLFPLHFTFTFQEMSPSCRRSYYYSGNCEYVNHHTNEYSTQPTLFNITIILCVLQSLLNLHYLLACTQSLRKESGNYKHVNL